jgi:putative transposase
MAPMKPCCRPQSCKRPRNASNNSKAPWAAGLWKTRFSRRVWTLPKQKVDCALASIARERAVRTVCCALGVSRSHVLAKNHRSSDWADRRRSPARADDTQVKQAITDVVHKQATYGYRRVCARLKLDDGHVGINHTRVYRGMRDACWLLFRQGQKPLDTRKHEGQVAVKQSNTRWCSDGLELYCCDREVMRWVATTKDIDEGLVGDLMIQAVENRFGTNEAPSKPIEWVTDNGSCYTVAETRSFAKLLGLKPPIKPVTSPQSKGMTERFVKTLTRDYAKLANRPKSKTVMRQLRAWFDDYNSYHPHSALGYLPPKLFRERQSVNKMCQQYLATGSRPSNSKKFLV